MIDRQLGPSRTTTLGDGRIVNIRPLVEGDRQALLAFGMALPQEDWLYLELDFHNPQTINRLVNAADAENWRQLVAEADGRIVGYTNVRLLPGWKSHVGDIHVVVAQGWRRNGLGLALARAILEAARALGVERVVAEMLEEQAGGRAIFTSLGFQVEGLLTEHARDQHGQRHNLVVLGYSLRSQPAPAETITPR